MVRSLQREGTLHIQARGATRAAWLLGPSSDVQVDTERDAGTVPKGLRVLCRALTSARLAVLDEGTCSEGLRHDTETHLGRA
jgi:hypothetical protein